MVQMLRERYGVNLIGCVYITVNLYLRLCIRYTRHDGKRDKSAKGREQVVTAEAFNVLVMPDNHGSTHALEVAIDDCSEMPYMADVAGTSTR